jgi:hypothetical protein
LSLEDPEEDFPLLLPVLACYILSVAFPFAPEIQNLAAFDSEFSPKYRGRVMRFYRAMLKRHLFFHGQERTLLSKNVSFTPFLQHLLAAFPDCKLVVCVRDPESTVPSQISSMEESWRAFGNEINAELFHRRWVFQMVYYYRHLRDNLPGIPAARVACLEMNHLRGNVKQVVETVYASFGTAMDPAFRDVLDEEDARAKAYHSRHQYSLGEYGLSQDEIAELFGETWPELEGRCLGHGTGGCRNQPQSSANSAQELTAHAS